MKQSKHDEDTYEVESGEITMFVNIRNTITLALDDTDSAGAVVLTRDDARQLAARLNRLAAEVDQPPTETT